MRNDLLNIIPLTNLPLESEGIFTYSAGDNTYKYGQIVEIPFRNKQIPGVVIGKPTGVSFDPGKLKTVIRHLYDKPLLTDNQLKLAQFCTDLYFSPISLNLKIALPDIPKGAARIFEQLKNPETAMRKRCNSANTLIISDQEQRFDFYRKKIKAVIKNRGQVLYLVPELAALYRAKDRLAGEFPKTKILEFHSQLGPASYFRNYLETINGGSAILLGTRQAVWLPFSGLELIIIDQEHNSSFKQWDAKPLYDSRELAAVLAKLHKSDLLAGSALPRVETYYAFSAKKNSTIRDGADFRSAIKGQNILVDMREELRAGNTSIFSSRLLDEMAATHERGGQTILFVNSRATHTFVMCRDCGKVLACDSCDAALLEFKDRSLTCPKCGKKHPNPGTCPQCGSYRLKGFGLGAEGVLAAVNKILPDAKTAVVSQEITRKKSSLTGTYRDFETSKIDILVGTRTVIPWKTFNVMLIGFLNIDALINFPDLNSGQKALSLLFEASSDGIKTIVQTYSPENPIFSFCRKNDYESYYNHELKLRRENSYPPFTKIAKLTYRHENEKRALEEARNAAKKLAVSSDKSIRMVGPIKPLTPKVRNKFFYEILLMIPQKLWYSRKFSASKTADQLKKLYGSWTIDIDPDTLA